MKHVQVYLESCFHHCGGPVRLVQARSCAHNAILTSEEVLGSTCSLV